MPAPDLFQGRWRIRHMETWPDDYLDLVQPAHITFGEGEEGELLFGTVRGWLDVRYGTRASEPCAEFSWEGISDTDRACGRGWAVLTGARRIEGHVFIHCSDDSGLVAEREAPVQ